MKEDEQHQLTEEMIREVDRFWEDPQRIMNLIDLLFLFEDPEKEQIVS